MSGPEISPGIAPYRNPCSAAYGTDASASAPTKAILAEDASGVKALLSQDIALANAFVTHSYQPCQNHERDEFASCPEQSSPSLLPVGSRCTGQARQVIEPPQRKSSPSHEP